MRLTHQCHLYLESSSAYVREHSIVVPMRWMHQYHLYPVEIDNQSILVHLVQHLTLVLLISRDQQRQHLGGCTPQPLGGCPHLGGSNHKCQHINQCLPEEGGSMDIPPLRGNGTIPHHHRHHHSGTIQWLVHRSSRGLLLLLSSREGVRSHLCGAIHRHHGSGHSHTWHHNSHL